MTSLCIRRAASHAGLIVLLAGVGASCVERTGSPTAAATTTTDRDAATAFTSSALVTMPAVWKDLYGAWPLARYEHGFAYDSDRKRVVVYGGRNGTSALFDDTWEWDGARKTWTERADTEGSPPERAAMAMAYDQVRKKTFMFGGWQPSAGVYASDQWEWDGAAGTWTERLTTGAQPSARYGHTMVWDSDRNRVVMFGGFGGPSRARLNDIWEWDGTGWTDRTPPGGMTKPTARLNASMVYDAGRKKIVLYGGNTGTAAPPQGTQVDETWEWDGATGAWSPVTVTSGMSIPYPYYIYPTHSLVYDPVGGTTYFYYSYNYIWKYNPGSPATWSMVTTTKVDTAAPPNPTACAVYDRSQASMVVFGYYNGGNRDTWEWYPSDGSWINDSVPSPVATPIGRTTPAMDYDTKRGNLMLFGGQSSSTSRQDIWQWSSTDQTWTDLTDLKTKPTGRYQSGIVYDKKRDRLLLFGGYNYSTGALDDLWEWSPMTRVWAPIMPAGTRPSARYAHTMFYDPVRDRVLVFGGSIYAMWEFDPTTVTWKDRSQNTGYPSISSFEVAFDYNRGKLVVYGQVYNNTTSQYAMDIYEWDVASGLWTERPPTAGAPAPTRRTGFGMSYDGARRVVVVIGGYVNETGIPAAYANDSWEWDGAKGTWSETTPPGLKPLPIQTPTLVYDDLHGSTLMAAFDATVPDDYTYGKNQLWEYAPNSAPRDNGAACSTATASRCSSGNCVDGVCCAAASCPGMCSACNVAGKEGTCNNVLPGQPDDTCAGDQACDANQQCKSRNGQACNAFGDCASGSCVDGVCCDTACTGACKVCNLNGKRGVCSNVPAGDEDAFGAPACVSDGDQGRFCDGNGVCTNAKKANGKPCTASGQCTSGNCIDGVCCNSTCNQRCYACNVGTTTLGSCTAIPAGQQDHSAYDTTTQTSNPCDGTAQYCASGVCQTNSAKKPNGATCTAAADCGSNLCVDGVCCNSTCTGQCQSCKVAGNLGSCVNVPAGSADDSCASTEYCDANATCQSGAKSNGLGCTMDAQCGSGHCADGVCCAEACTSPCHACNLSGAGTCDSVFPGATDQNAATPCVSPNYCAAGGMCTTGRKPNGATCDADNQCGSNACVDGVCCETACSGKCRTCKNATGTCMLAADGQDPREDCTGDGTCGGVCNGQGACRFPPSGLKCRDAGCQSDGYIATAGTCDGAGHCMFGITKDCMGFVCFTQNGMDMCRTDCATDPQCVSKNYCDQNKCPVDLDNGTACARDTQCKSTHCAFAHPGDTMGLCCDRACDVCGSCNMPGMEGTCVPAPADSPDVRCTDSASDPTGKCGGKCNGHWGCSFADTTTVCGTCKTCDGSGKCNVKPDDDVACGTVDCDGLDSPSTCLDYHDLVANRCASVGVCKKDNDPATCTSVTQTCTGDGSGGDGAPATDGANDAPPKGGGGGGCCSVGAAPGSGGGALTLQLVLFGGLVGLARRRRRR